MVAVIGLLSVVTLTSWIKNMTMNIRALAAKCCYAVIDQGRSLSDELPKQQDKLIGKDKGLLQEI